MDWFPKVSGPVPVEKSVRIGLPAIRAAYPVQFLQVQFLDLQKCRSNFGTVPVPDFNGTV